MWTFYIHSAYALNDYLKISGLFYNLFLAHLFLVLGVCLWAVLLAVIYSTSCQGVDAILFFEKR